MLANRSVNNMVLRTIRQAPIDYPSDIQTNHNGKLNSVNIFNGTIITNSDLTGMKNGSTMSYIATDTTSTMRVNRNRTSPLLTAILTECNATPNRIESAGARHDTVTRSINRYKVNRSTKSLFNTDIQLPNQPKSTKLFNSQLKSTAVSDFGGQQTLTDIIYNLERHIEVNVNIYFDGITVTIPSANVDNLTILEELYADNGSILGLSLIHI